MYLLNSASKSWTITIISICLTFMFHWASLRNLFLISFLISLLCIFVSSFNKLNFYEIYLCMFNFHFLVFIFLFLIEKHFYSTGSLEGKI